MRRRGAPRPAEETGWKPTYLFSFFFICWPWSHVRTRSSHFCDGGRKNNLGMLGEARASPSACSPSPRPGPAPQVSQQDVWLHTEELQGKVRVEERTSETKDGHCARLVVSVHSLKLREEGRVSVAGQVQPGPAPHPRSTHLQASRHTDWQPSCSWTKACCSS